MVHQPAPNQGPLPKTLRRFSSNDGISIENIMPKIERTFLQVGAMIGKYRIIEEVDRGGMAVVYRAVQLDLDREVALKVLPANVTINRRFVDRFLSEAHAIARLSHPNIVNIHEVAMEDNIYFLAMDYIPGKNLYYHLHAAKPKLVDVLEVTATLAEALAYAHRQRIVHRDLKLNNVIMRENKMPVLIDFGLAKALEADEGGITQTGEIMGSPAYMAPERLLGGRTDARSDICSLGIMLYEMLTFKNPYLDPRSIHQTTMNVLESNPIPPHKLVPWLPVEIEAITLKAMHADPEKRYQSMEEFRDDIRRYQKGQPVTAKRPSLLLKSRLFAKRNWPFLTIGAMSILFVTFLVLILYSQSRKEQPFWQVVCQEDFTDSILNDQWTVPNKPDEWVIRDGALHAQGTSRSFVRINRTFTRDLRIEFEVIPTGSELANVGLFAYGDSPENSYCFHLFYGGEARSGITFPGSSFLVYENNPFEHPLGKPFRVVVERKNNLISYSVNDIRIAEVWDLFPYLGPGYQKVGFFVNGWGCQFDNLKISQMALPQLPSPSMIANRFWERGEFSAALEEYTPLLQVPGKTVNREGVLLRIADCLLRTGGFARAESLLTYVLHSSSASDDQKASALHLRGILDEWRGNPRASRRSHAEVNVRYPLHPANESAFIRMLLVAADSLRGGNLVWADEAACSLVETYPRQHVPLVGKLHGDILRRYLERGREDSVLAVGRRLVSVYGKWPSVVAELKLIMGEACLNQQQKAMAIDYFNQCAITVSSEASWKAWMRLASIYEWDFDGKNALGIYSKVADNAPSTSVLPFLARIRMADIGARTGVATDWQPAASHSLFGSLLPLPQRIMSFYRGECTEQQFRRQVEALATGETALYHLARKAQRDGDRAKTVAYLQELRDGSRPRSWFRHSLERALMHWDKW